MHGYGAFVLAKKITQIREHLKHWAKFDFGSIKLKKLALLHDIEQFDVIRESHSLSTEEGAKDVKLRIELGQILKQEEIYSKQGARITWLKKGDKNTRFFLDISNGL